MPLLCHYYRWFKIEEDLGELMSGVFFMEFSIYLVYFSACHVYWLILIVICPTASWVFQGWASSKYCKSRHRAPYPPGRCRQLVRPMWSHPVTSGAPRRHPHPRCPRPRLVARQLRSSCRKPRAPVQKQNIAGAQVAKTQAS